VVVPVVTTAWKPVFSLISGDRIPILATATAAVASPVVMAGNRWSLPWIAVVYALLIAFLSLRLAWQWWRLRDLTEDTVSVPVAFGLRDPKILLPRRFAEEAPELAKQAALAHENVHVRHRDFGVNLLLEAVTLPVAFHPLLVWMKRRTVEDVEMRCDEQAAQLFEDRRQYALGLIEAAKVLGTPPAPCLTASFFDHDTFEERVMNLMKLKKTPARWVRLGMAACLVLAGSVVFGVSSGFAAPQEDRVYKVSEEGVTSPKVLYRVEPKYSESAREAKISGTAVLTMEIATNGKAEKIRILRSLEETLDLAAIESLEQWDFEPGKKDGVPVRVQATVEVNFRLQ
jgi:TonB family protein